MRKCRTAILLLIWMLVPGVALSYELATHARVTAVAAGGVLPTVLANLGLPSHQYTLLGTTYYDVKGTLQGSTNRLRNAKRYDFDRDKMPGVAGDRGDKLIPFRATGWLMRGAVREDDGDHFAGVDFPRFNAEQVQPYDDPYVNINRFCYHFFDPYRNLPFHGYVSVGCGDAILYTAPVWASGVIDPFISTAGSAVEDVSRRNHFTLYDARESLWRALTGLNGNMFQTAVTTTERKAYWATMFRALGDVLHLNQDMAQPQHTRNESHGTSHGSDFEKYIDARAKGDSKITLGNLSNGKVNVATTALSRAEYDGYPPVGFSHYSKFWSTGSGNASLTGKGLADYTSRGFFTPDKNIGHTEFPLPIAAASAYATQTLPPQGQSGYSEQYLIGAVNDYYTNTTTSDVRMVRLGIWYKAVESSPVRQSKDVAAPRNDVIAPGGRATYTRGTYSIDPRIFDDRAALLLPRATAYSAGLLNYFFNPRLRIDLPVQGAYAIADHGSQTGFTRVLLRVTNVTPALNDPGGAVAQHMFDGKLVAVVKYHVNSCYASDLSGEYGAPGKSAEACRQKNSAAEIMDTSDFAESIAVSQPLNDPVSLNAGESKELAFDFSASPIPFGVSDVYLQVVYRGAIGADRPNAEPDVVAVGTKDISEPTYLTYHNSLDYIRFGDTVVTRSELQSRQDLLAQVRPTACVTGSPGAWRLRDDCFQNAPLDVDITVDRAATPAVKIRALPSRRFVRFALLTDASATLPVQAPVAIPSDAAGGAAADAVITQDSPCLPIRTFELPAIRNQLSYLVDPPSYFSTQTTIFRNVVGYRDVICTNIGDGSSPVNWNVPIAAFSPLVGAERAPFPVTVDPAFVPVRAVALR